MKNVQRNSLFIITFSKLDENKLEEYEKSIYDQFFLAAQLLRGKSLASKEFTDLINLSPTDQNLDNNLVNMTNPQDFKNEDMDLA